MKQISRSRFFSLNLVILVGFRLKGHSLRARPFFISVKYFIKQAAVASLFAPGGRHTNSGSVTRRPRFIMAVRPPPPVLRTGRRELCILHLARSVFRLVLLIPRFKSPSLIFRRVASSPSEKSIAVGFTLRFRLRRICANN